MIEQFYDLRPEVLALDRKALDLCRAQFAHVEEIRDYNQLKMLRAFTDCGVEARHFWGSSGYGVWDDSRNKLEEVFARCMGAEAALVRPQFMSGTHTLTVALFGLLRTGDTLLAATGRPYDTLEGVIGIGNAGKGCGTLREFGVNYDECPLLPDFTPDYDLIAEKAKTATVVHIQRSRGWKTELTSADENGIGGFKDATLLINGAGAYSRMKYESGTHRVQRVPETESGGRIHTSTMTVAIMPEVDDVEVQIDPKDYKFDVFRASGNGGQCVNTTDSAVRLTHFPSGIVISCQDEKSQLKNKDKALKILRARLYDLEQQKQHDEMAELRKSQVGTGDRSEKIRTYNFPQGRVTDHRIKLTLYKLDAIMNGDLDEIIDSLIAADQAAKLSSMQEEA